MAAQVHDVFFSLVPLEIPYLWRYSSFAKFVSMLSQKGYISHDSINLTTHSEVLCQKQTLLFLILMCPPTFQLARPLLRNIETYDERNYLKLFYPWLRKGSFACTWHMSEHESAAMWKLYARTEEAVCIRSTYARLQKALPDDVYLGRVQYIDYVTTCHSL